MTFGCVCRYEGEYLLPATHLPQPPQGPAVWCVQDSKEAAAAVASLWRDPLERRSRYMPAAKMECPISVWMTHGIICTAEDLHELSQVPS